MTADSTPPSIENCPDNIIEWVATGNTQATVTWTPPTATDNYGTPTLETTHDPGSTFSLGTTVVTYTAIDMVNNQAECVFGVTVLGKGLILIWVLYDEGIVKDLFSKGWYSRKVTNFSQWLTLEFSHPFLWSTTC